MINDSKFTGRPPASLHGARRDERAGTPSKHSRSVLQPADAGDSSGGFGEPTASLDFCARRASGKAETDHDEHHRIVRRRSLSPVPAEVFVLQGL